MQVKKHQSESDMKKWIGSKYGKKYVKVVYCHPAYLAYMQSTSCKMLGWMKHKPESRLPGEISIASDMQMTPPLWHFHHMKVVKFHTYESKEELKNLLMKVKEDSEELGLKPNIQKTKMACGPITSWQIYGETMKTVRDFVFVLQNHCRW